MSWTQMGDPPVDVRRYTASQFALAGIDWVDDGEEGLMPIGLPQYGYYVTGRNDDPINLKTCWRYDAVDDSWSQMADAPQIVRQAKGYTSLDQDFYALDQFQNLGHIVGGTPDAGNWTKAHRYYDPATNLWGTAVSLTVGTQLHAVFVVDDHAYVTGGQCQIPHQENDNWEFSHQNLTNWNQKSNVPASGGSRNSHFAFALSNGKGYIGGGGYGVTPYIDLWEYDPTGGNWTQKANILTTKLSGASAAPTENILPQGYVFGGNSSNGRRLYKYDPEYDEWTILGDVPSSQQFQSFPAMFILYNIIFMGLGRWASAGNDASEFWSYDAGIGVNTSVAVQAPAVKRRPPIFDFSRGLDNG